MTESASSNHCEQVRHRSRYELATALDRIPFQRTHVLILVLVGSGTLLNAIEEYNVGFAAPLLAGQWSLSDAQVGLLTTLTFAGMAIGLLIACITGDRYGRRVTYIYNLALYTAGAVLAAFCPGFGWLLVARFIVGIGLSRSIESLRGWRKGSPPSPVVGAGTRLRLDSPGVAVSWWCCSAAFTRKTLR